MQVLAREGLTPSWLAMAWEAQALSLQVVAREALMPSWLAMAREAQEAFALLWLVMARGALSLS